MDVTPRKITAKLPRMRRKSTVNSDSDLSFPGLAYQSDSASGLTDEGVSALKYQRMRDLNNEASRRCRENRKTKQGDAEAELDALRQKNITLKQNVHALETKVSRLKRKFLVSVKQPSREIALARQRQLGQSLAISPDMVGTFMAPDADIKPELDAFWSQTEATAEAELLRLEDWAPEVDTRCYDGLGAEAAENEERVREALGFTIAASAHKQWVGRLQKLKAQVLSLVAPGRPASKLELLLP